MLATANTEYMDLSALAAQNPFMRAGDTPLIDAAQHARLDRVVELLADGADVNEREATDRSMAPLSIACTLGHTEVVVVLLAANAEVDMRDNFGTTPLCLASEFGRNEIVEKLLTANANVHHSFSTSESVDEGWNSLTVACRNGHADVVKTLLAANAEVDHIKSNKDRPLHIACEFGHAEIVATLLESNATVDAMGESTMADEQDNPDDYTPMYIACAHGHLRCVQLLSAYGASREFTAGVARGETAWSIVDAEGHEHVSQWLAETDDWTLLHHIEFLTADHALALLRGGASITPTLLDLAKELCMTGAAAAGSAAHVVLEWGAPWKRTTHKFYPPAVRERVAARMRIAQAIKRGKASYEIDGRLVGYANPGSVADVFESCVIPHAAATWEVWRADGVEAYNEWLRGAGEMEAAAAAVEFDISEFGIVM